MIRSSSSGQGGSPCAGPSHTRGEFGGNFELLTRRVSEPHISKPTSRCTGATSSTMSPSLAEMGCPARRVYRKKQSFLKLRTSEQQEKIPSPGRDTEAGRKSTHTRTVDVMPPSSKVLHQLQSEIASDFYICTTFGVYHIQDLFMAFPS